MGIWGNEQRVMKNSPFLGLLAPSLCTVPLVLSTLGKGQFRNFVFFLIRKKPAAAIGPFLCVCVRAYIGLEIESN
jgi:hypothetical protein